MAQIILISGIPGSGKTTVSLALAKHFKRLALIEGDVIQHVLTFRGCVGPMADPTPESERHYRLRWQNCLSLAKNFYDEGFTVILEQVAEPKWIEWFRDHLAGRTLSVITLLPRVEVALARDRDRQGKTVAERYTFLDDRLRRGRLGYHLDTSELTVTQTVERILQEGIALGRLESEEI